MFTSLLSSRFTHLVLCHRHIQKQELILTYSCSRCDSGPIAEHAAGGSNARARAQLKLRVWNAQTNPLKLADDVLKQTLIKRIQTLAQSCRTTEGALVWLLLMSGGVSEGLAELRVVCGANCDNRQTCSLVPWQRVGCKYGSKSKKKKQLDSVALGQRSQQAEPGCLHGALEEHA